MEIEKASTTVKRKNKKNNTKHQIKSSVTISYSARKSFKRAFALGGFPIMDPSENYIFEDSIAIMDDWRKVGNDIFTAQEKYKEIEPTRILREQGYY